MKVSRSNSALLSNFVEEDIPATVVDMKTGV